MRRGLDFVSHAQYLNPARVAPSVVKIVGGQAVMSKTGANTIFLTTGIVGDCHLVKGVPCGPGETPVTSGKSI
jgi:hypothetical protein